MIQISRKEDCCGCSACFDVCSHQAIAMIPDKEGFLYPNVLKDKCVNCDLCKVVCPIINSEKINQKNQDSKPIVLGVYHKNPEVRFTSTSGGAFWGLAEHFLNNGGYVAGAIFTERFEVKHIVTNNINELQKIKGSKYVQSDCRNLYSQIKKLLIKGEKVLATGLPCQMAALRSFLKKNYDNLLVVDLICHSVTSPLAFRKYLEHLEKKYNSKMISYHPKNKEYGGWHNFAFKAIFENGKIYRKNGCNDSFTTIFVGSRNLFSRFSCYECRYKHYPQPSDITIGDFWGIEKIDPSFDSPYGVSKVILNNEKGKRYFQSLDCFESKEYEADISIFNNPRSASMIQSASRCDINKRKSFVDDLINKDFEFCMAKHFMPEMSFKQRIKKKIKLLCLSLKSILNVKGADCVPQ